MTHNEQKERVKDAKSRIDFVAYNFDRSRINVTFDNNDVLVVSIDLHYLRIEESRKLLHNIIAVTRGQFVLKVVHGYNHGTALREMVQRDDFSTRIKSRKLLEYNEGISLLEIAA